MVVYRIQCDCQLGEVLQDRAHGRPIAAVLRHIAPYDSPVGIDDEYGWRRVTAAQELVDAKGLGHLVVRISQQWVGRVDRPSHCLVDGGYRSDSDGDKLYSRVLERPVLLPQLNQLRAVRPSGAPLEKDEDHGPVRQVVVKGESASAGNVQGEGRGGLRYLRL